MTASTLPAPPAAFTVPQERRIVTEIPGPKSRELRAIAAIISHPAQAGMLLPSAGACGYVLRFRPSRAVTGKHSADTAQTIDDVLAAL